jgi:hypothetical protein
VLKPLTVAALLPAVKVKWSALPVAEVPAAAVTVISTSPGAARVDTAVMELSELTTKSPWPARRANGAGGCR